jgi:hypothetical protein
MTCAHCNLPVERDLIRFHICRTIPPVPAWSTVEWPIPRGYRHVRAYASGTDRIADLERQLAASEAARVGERDAKDRAETRARELTYLFAVAEEARVKAEGAIAVQVDGNAKLITRIVQAEADLATERGRVDWLESALELVSWTNKSWIAHRRTKTAEIVAAMPDSKWIGTQRTHGTLRGAIDDAREKEKG